jgi:methionyl aminopeptidase
VGGADIKSIAMMRTMMRRGFHVINENIMVTPRVKPQIPLTIATPSYAHQPAASQQHPRYLTVKTPAEIESMRRAGRLASKVIRLAGSLLRPGVTTRHVDEQCHDFILSHKAYPSPLNYMGFPYSICTSVNNVVCHGRPDDRVLLDGDLVSVDVTVFMEGVHADTCFTFPVGCVDDAGMKLIDTAQRITHEAIELVKPGRQYKEIGAKIETMCEQSGYGTVKEFCGHGIGRSFHELPYVMHCRNNDKTMMVPGHVFTIEPMITEGDNEIGMWDDEFTIATTDELRCAQFEHTVLVTETGHEILTL